MPTYTTYPAVDENYLFAPEIMAALTKASSFYRGQILSTESLDTFMEAGMWSYYSNNPTAPGGVSGTLIVSPILNNNSTILTQFAIDYGTDTNLRKRYRGSGGWSSWKIINQDTLWTKGQIPNGVDAREYMYENGAGQYSSWTGTSTGSMTGLPKKLMDTPLGFTAVAEILNSGIVITLTPYDVWGNTRYVCTSAPSGSDGWTKWSEVQWVEEDDGSKQISSQPASGYKTFPYILTGGTGGNEPLAPLSANVEYDVNLSPDIYVSRYRFAIRDGNPRWGTSTAQAIKLTNVKFNGVTRNTALTTNADGSIFFSPWYTGGLGNLSFDYVATQGPRYIIGGGKLNGTRRVTMPFELWIEMEVPSDTPAIGLFGDSNSIANNATIPIHDAWMSQYCREKGFFPVLYGHSGDAMSASGDPKHYKWNRWNHLDNPDVIIHANGANDMIAEVTLATLQASAKAEWAVGSKFSTKQHTALIKSKASGENDVVRKGLNSWYKNTPDPTRDWHDIASPVTSGDSGGLLVQYISSDGIHMNTAGHTAIKNALIAAKKDITVRNSMLTRGTTGVVWDNTNKRELYTTLRTTP